MGPAPWVPLCFERICFAGTLRSLKIAPLLLMNVIFVERYLYTTSRYLLSRRSYFVKSARWYSLSQNMTDSTLSQFLASSKDRYLNDVQQGKGRNWTVVMGNEAGGRSDHLYTKQASQLPLRSRLRRIIHCIRMDPIGDQEDSYCTARPNEANRFGVAARECIRVVSCWAAARNPRTIMHRRCVLARSVPFQYICTGRP